MAESKSAESFGLDGPAIQSIDWQLALSRVAHDLRSDFIYAPHLAIIYHRAGTELVTAVTADLKAGAFSPGVPLTIEVPKSYRIRIAAASKRLGPSYSRPGSILLPRDRLLYQALGDQAAPIIDGKTAKDRSFSHQLAAADSAAMFLPTRTCWSDLQKALAKHAKKKTVRYILKVDVANFFGSLNQHTLINVLNDAGYKPGLSSKLEIMLVRYTGDRSSRGILQGMYTSDLIGNFYMAPIDRFLADRSIPSARYVDDMYIFVESVDAADKLLRELIPSLRAYDLVLNEAKSVIMPKSSLITEEPDLEALFADAVAEMAAQVEDEDFDADYGFQSEWDADDETDEEAEDENADLELKATTILFDSLSEYPGQEENIERFCLPLFSKAQSDYAIDHVIDAFKKRPSMSQIYASYLSRFLDTNAVMSFLLGLLSDTALVDWQKMWVLAALLRAPSADDASVKAALDIFRDANRHEALHADAAIYVGRYGDHARRTTLVSSYASVSNFIQLAIYFSSRYWPAVERRNAKASWSGHGSLHNLVTIAMGKK